MPVHWRITRQFIGVLRSFHFSHAKVWNLWLIITHSKALTQYVYRMVNVLPFDATVAYNSASSWLRAFLYTGQRKSVSIRTCKFHICQHFHTQLFSEGVKSNSNLLTRRLSVAYGVMGETLLSRIVGLWPNFGGRVGRVALHRILMK